MATRDDVACDEAGRLFGNANDSAGTHLADEFRRLAQEWKTETRHCSKMEQITSHPAYRQIVEMGEPVVPLILQDLDRSGGDWFQALREITKTNPVPAESRGKVREIQAAWLKWGREHGYEWTK